MTKRDHQAKEYAEESGSLDGYHPTVRDFILGQGCFSQEAQIEAARRVGEKIGKAAAKAMNDAFVEQFAPRPPLAPKDVISILAEGDRRCREIESRVMAKSLKAQFAAVDKIWDELKQPCANAAECSSPVSKTGEGQSGMRTERVTLELTHDLDARLSDWIVEVVDESLGLMESVRVVEDDRVLAASKKLIEVDQEAALRGFDTTTFQRLWISAIARVLGLELARPPRSKCDNPGDGSIPSPGILASPALVEAHQQIAALTAERDSAIRERDNEKQRADRDSVKCSALADKVISLRARVAELEAARITKALTADRFASAVAEADVLRARVAELEAQTSTPSEGSRDAAAASVVWFVVREMTAILRSNTADADEKHAAMATLVEAVCPGWALTQAASGGGGLTPHQWNVLLELHDAASAFRDSSIHAHQVRLDKAIAAAERLLTQPRPAVPASGGGEQPRGWLTEEEIDAVADAADTLSLRGCGSERRARILRELLARSTPPEVVRPGEPLTFRYGDNSIANRDGQWISALAAAGVAVKEVGRE